MLIAHHFATLPDGVPEWLHLVPAGSFHGVDGRGPYTLGDADAVIRASMADGEKLAVDENHSIDLAGAAGQPSPARGWIVELQARADGIWGRVEWTPTGAQLMAELAYRGVSPVFEHEKGGAVLKILRAALTNNPNLKQLTTLHQQETGMDLKAIRVALGLPETADEAAIVTAATASHAAVAAHGVSLARIRTAAGLDATVTPEAIAAALQARTAGMTGVAKMAETITGLETQIATMRSTQGKAAATAFVDGAIAAGKPIVSLRDHYIARHVADSASVEKEIGALVAINAGGIVIKGQHAAGEDADDALTEADEWVVQKMGLDPKAYAEHKKTAKSATDGRAA